MRSREWVAAALALMLGGSAVGAQETALGRASDLELAGKLREAAAAYAQALREGATTSAVLGLERVYAEMGWTDSLLPRLDSLVRAQPRDEMLRTVQLRSLQRAGREAEAQQAWERWRSRAPRDPLPYREYARILLDAGRIVAADSVLRSAQAALGTGRAVALELAQLRATMGLWVPSAASWREALEGAPYLEQAATYALRPAPDSVRPAIRAELLRGPVVPGARRTLAALELAWGDAGAGWRALAELPPDDSTVAGWVAFADQAAQARSWRAARDAYAAALARRPDAGVAARGAEAALAAGDPRGALEMLERLGDDPTLVALRVRALGRLGRAAEAARAVAALPPEQGAAAQRDLALAWARAGELSRAEEALRRAGADPDDETFGWLALYAGDLARARPLLRWADAPGDDALLARALLVRTRAERAPEVGAAFLALARTDSGAAAEAFVRAADATPDAAPLLLAAAARLRAAAGDRAGATALWRTLVERHPSAPEAAEADLLWARELRSAGDAAGAMERLEHLIVTYPTSALVPQARRELDLARPPMGRAQTPE
ncbi:MAG TPA: hypothetical protein VFY16_07995 [Gemmatimonadaceae bacterium]|nr:hypothetical protein [Gemmatimonadaceae bacterium]